MAAIVGGAVCGRYAAATDPAALVEEFEVSAPPEELLEPDYNVAPTGRFPTGRVSGSGRSSSHDGG